MVKHKIIGHILLPNVMITINTCLYKRLWRYLLISPVSQKVKGWEEREVPTQAFETFFLLTVNSLDTIKSFVFPHQNQHFLLAKTDKHYLGFLITTDCKQRESIYKLLQNFVIHFIFPKDPFDEPCYKMKKANQA